MNSPIRTQLALPASFALLPRNFLRTRFGQGLRIFLIWTVVGLFLGAVETHATIYWPTVAGKVFECWAWALLTPAILFIDRRMSDAKWGLAKRIGLLLVLSIPFTVIHIYLAAALQFPFTEIDWNPLRYPDNYVYYFSAGWLTYCAFIGTLQTFHYYRNYANSQIEVERLEKALLQTHLNALRLQLEPHFLFNALNAIAFEVLSEPQRARQMVLDLAALLRLSVNYKHRETVLLSEEIAFLRHYLSIQTARFGGRLKIEMAIAPDTTSARVPSLLLQPIVENAIRHGLSERLSGGTVTITANRVDGHLDIRVLDDGVGLKPGWQMEQCTGLGLRVTSERLASLYPDGASRFEVRNRPDQGVEVLIWLPLRSNDGDSDDSGAE
jgi:two-component system LytT family sensor kinase